MEILKKTHAAPAKCNFTPTHVTIDMLALPRDTPVPLPLSRQYALDQLCFYLVNTDMAYTEYLKKCKATGILQVSYVDQKKLVEIVSSYRAVGAVTAFDPSERHRCEEDYAFVAEHLQRRRNYKIVVPSSYQSLLKIGNAQAFLERGVFAHAAVSLDDASEVRVFGRFTVCTSAGSGDDVVAVFLDGSKWQYRDWKWPSLAKMASEAAVFFLYSNESDRYKFETLDVTTIRVGGEGKVGDDVFAAMWAKINLKANQQ